MRCVQWMLWPKSFGVGSFESSSDHNKAGIKMSFGRRCLMRDAATCVRWRSLSRFQRNPLRKVCALLVQWWPIRQRSKDTIIQAMHYQPAKRTPYLAFGFPTRGVSLVALSLNVCQPGISPAEVFRLLHLSFDPLLDTRCNVL